MLLKYFSSDCVDFEEKFLSLCPQTNIRMTSKSTIPLMGKRNDGRGNFGITLTTDELNKLRVLYNRAENKTQLAISLGIGREVLARMVVTGSGREENIKKIRKAVRKVEVPEEMDRPE